MDNEQNTVQMLLAEFQMLSDAFQKEFELDHQRLNLHITLISAGLGGLLLIGKEQRFNDQTSLFIALLILIILILMGSFTLKATISSRIVIDEYYRGMNRIRVFFADKDTKFRKFIVFPLDDRPTSMLSVDGRTRTAPASHYMMQTLVMLNSALIFLIIIDIFLFFGLQTLPLPNLYFYLPFFLIALYGAIVTWRFQKAYYRCKLLNASQTALTNAHFDGAARKKQAAEPAQGRN